MVFIPCTIIEKMMSLTEFLTVSNAFKLLDLPKCKEEEEAPELKVFIDTMWSPISHKSLLHELRLASTAFESLKKFVHTEIDLDEESCLKCINLDHTEKTGNLHIKNLFYSLLKPYWPNVSELQSKVHEVVSSTTFPKSSIALKTLEQQESKFKSDSCSFYADTFSTYVEIFASVYDALAFYFSVWRGSVEADYYDMPPQFLSVMKGRVCKTRDISVDSSCLRPCLYTLKDVLVTSSSSKQGGKLSLYNHKGEFKFSLEGVSGLLCSIPQFKSIKSLIVCTCAETGVSSIVECNTFLQTLRVVQEFTLPKGAQDTHWIDCVIQDESKCAQITWGSNDTLRGNEEWIMHAGLNLRSVWGKDDDLFLDAAESLDIQLHKYNNKNFSVVGNTLTLWKTREEMDSDRREFCSSSRIMIHNILIADLEYDAIAVWGRSNVFITVDSGGVVRLHNEARVTKLFTLNDTPNNFTMI